MATEERNRAALAAGQARHDAASPPEVEEGEPWRCNSCWASFDISERVFAADDDEGACPSCKSKRIMQDPLDDFDAEDAQ